MHWIIFLVLTSQTITVHSQTWAGVYNVDSNCVQAFCCCVKNQMVLTRPATDTLTYNTTLGGSLCLGMTSFAGSGGYPIGYSGSLSFFVITVTVTLNSDSSVLTVSSTQGAHCTSTAVRVVQNAPATTIKAAATTVKAAATTTKAAATTIKAAATTTKAAATTTKAFDTTTAKIAAATSTKAAASTTKAVDITTAKIVAATTTKAADTTTAKVAAATTTKAVATTTKSADTTTAKIAAATTAKTVASTTKAADTTTGNIAAATSTTQVEIVRPEPIVSDEIPENSGSGIPKSVPGSSSGLFPTYSTNPEPKAGYDRRFQPVPVAGSSDSFPATVYEPYTVVSSRFLWPVPVAGSNDSFPATVYEPYKYVLSFPAGISCRCE